MYKNKMNKKGQSLNGIIIVFIALIVGLVLFQTISQLIGDTTNTIEVVNTTLTTVVNGTAQYLTDYRAIDDVVIYNETGGTVGSGNYTVTNNVVYNGALAVEILPEATAAWKYAWKVSGTAQPLTYIDDGGSRSVATLVGIIIALAIAGIALYPVYEGKLWEIVGK